MGEAIFSFTVDEELRNNFAAAAEAQQRAGEDLLRDYMREIVQEQQDAGDYDEWFRQSVQKGLDDVAAGRVMSSEDAEKEMNEFKTIFLRDRAGNKNR